jgi:hypothetical protein
MSAAKERILQLLPAEGWEAMFEDEDNVTVICFALVETVDEEGTVSSAVRPMASIGTDIEFCDDYPNFEGLVRADDAWDEEDEEEEE